VYPQLRFAALANGVKVELMGVSENPSKDRSWWRPDGSPLDRRPYDWLGSSVTPGEHQIGREIAVQLGDLSSEPASVIWKVTPSFSTAGTSPVSGLNNAMPNVYAVAAVIPTDKAVADVSVGVAGGTWKTVIEVPSQISHSAGVPGGFVAFSEAYEKDGKLFVPVATSITGVPLRVIAVGKDGREHPGGGLTSHGPTMNQITASFGKLALADVKVFRLQSRPYLWVEFRNVSLQIGQKTDVQVVVSDISVQEQQKAPQRQSSDLKKVDFVIGPHAFANGDEIVIEEVRSELGTLAKGDIVTVKGTYTLASRSNAKLAFYVTQGSKDPPDDSPAADHPVMPIQAGSSSFELKHRIKCNGHLHISFYPVPFSGSFGAIYFGTESQMKEIAHWNVEGWVKKTAEEIRKRAESVIGHPIVVPKPSAKSAKATKEKAVSGKKNVNMP